MTRNPPPKKRLLKTISLAAVIFLTVSGGPYGLESLLGYAGKDKALLLLLIVPLLWDLPTILMVFELNSLMPVEGGYYKWVNRALGRRWAFYEGWWTWLYSFADLAIYPVLFTTYFVYFFPALATYKIAIRWIIIWACAGLNILGIVPVGRASLIFSSVIIIPFVILFGTAFSSPAFHAVAPSVSLHGLEFGTLGMALYTVMWNFLGWDNTTTYAGEVNKPARSYIISTSIAFVIVIVLYALTVFVSQNSGVDYAKLGDEGYPLLGSIIGGNRLASLISVGGMASAIGIFSAVMLSISRIPRAMAEDKFMPAVLAKTHSRFNTPFISIIICAVVVSLMDLGSFGELVVIDVILYGAGLLLEYISLIVLRIKEPDAPRPFKIPLNTFLLALLLILPTAVYLIALISVLGEPEGSCAPAYFAIGGLLTAEIAWLLIRKRAEKG